MLDQGSLLPEFPKNTPSFDKDYIGVRRILV